MKSLPSRILYGTLCVYLLACNGEDKQTPDDPAATLFTLLPADSTHVDFNNRLEEGLNTNVLLYEYFYNGGGVAIGDVDGDGWDDLYFSANMTDNKLYLNNGKWQFQDVTESAGVAGRPGPWKTGVCMVDINGDHRLDIFVCYSGKLPGEKRTNQLFINTGNDSAGIPQFRDQAAAYGLADSAYTTHAAFFDYDRDNDLDLFLLNHNPNSLPVLDESSTAAILKQKDPMSGVRLFRNDKGFFKDVTDEAGISSSTLTYGLGAGIADINSDGWPDIYISNDYAIPDFLYINNHDGSFSNQLSSSFGHISEFSMGNDIADINNDALPDIFTLDMLPEDNRRQKLLFAPDNYEKFALNVNSGFHYQYMRNMLQLNNGNGTFSEIGQLSGLSNTDWSWSPLLADFDNDGFKDLLVTNGYLRDFTNMDFMKYMNDFIQSKGRLKRDEVLDLVHQMPASNVTNYFFKNNGDLTFSNKSREWGFTTTSNSNGAAYADLDLDGDLDLVINNINQPAFIFRNESDKQPDNHYLIVHLQGVGKNKYAVGAVVTIYQKGRKQVLEQMPSRGFQSSVSPVLHFGLGADAAIDSLLIVWPGGKQYLSKNLLADHTYIFDESGAQNTYQAGPSDNNIDNKIFQPVKPPVSFQHAAGHINDFKRQPLLVNPLSTGGPCMAKADINGDGLEDLFTGGGMDQPGAIFTQLKNGQFVATKQPALEADKASEDADALFVDVNGDGILDLYVCSGGYHNYLPGDSLLQDRIYLNDGKGKFKRDFHALPVMRMSTSCVRSADINMDGYPDLFVGGRVIPGRYPEVPESYLLLNDGKGHFTDVIQQKAPGLQKAGMITDAAWTDLNGDQVKDLVVLGEWMPVAVYINQNAQLVEKTSQYFDQAYTGWWNRLLLADVDNDGVEDIIAGNFGTNTQCRASDKQPVEMYYKDFDNNGAVDPVLCLYIQGKSYPYVTRDELLEQLTMMRTRFTDYKGYADAGLQDVFTKKELEGAQHLSANQLETTLFIRGKDGVFHKKDLPVQAQFMPVFSISAADFDHDGNKDLLLFGNINQARLRFGKSDAGYGTLLKGDGKGNFTYIDQRQSGLNVSGDVRSVTTIGNTLLIGVNSKNLLAYQFR